MRVRGQAGAEVNSLHHLHRVQTGLKIGRQRDDDPRGGDFVVVRRDLRVINEHERCLAAQLLTVYDKIVAGKNRLIGDNRIALRRLRLQELDRRMFEWQHKNVPRAHRQSRLHRFLAFDQHHRRFVNRRRPILREERRPDFRELLD